MLNQQAYQKEPGKEIAQESLSGVKKNFKDFTQKLALQKVQNLIRTHCAASILQGMDKNNRAIIQQLAEPKRWVLFQ